MVDLPAGEAEGRTAVVVLAAGGSTRFGGAKQLAPLGSASVLHRSLEAARCSGLTPVSCVLGAEIERIRPTVPSGVEIVDHPGWQEGLASSLRAAIRTFDSDSTIRAVVVALGDQPLIGSEAYRRLDQVHRRSGAAFVVATYGAMRAHPVLLGRQLWPELLELSGDVGARQLMGRHPVTEVACDDTGDPRDVDTPADLERLAARWSGEPQPSRPSLTNPPR
jgi:CTP:molybdopterin cytidylyltransferase MocA